MSTSNWVGKTLSNRYVIEEMLGQGGMSAVYKATDPNLKRVVAVKLIHTHLSSNPDFVKRFEEEATAVAQLRHHGIVQVYDFNQDNGVYYMILEFVPGETIQDHLKRLNDSGRKLSPRNAIQYMIDACEAVDYAHQRGMIHRDIKPANLMLNTSGHVILMDFGIAKIVGSQRHTATGAVVGTAMYMSPEQIKGEQPDRRTDIYSLGVTLFEMVGGRPPYEAESAMTLMMMHINDPIPDPRKLNPDVPEALVAVINKALAKDPNQRYQTCAEMASALRNALAQLDSPKASSATRLEDATLRPSGPGATTIEPPSGTVVESGPMQGYQGTMVESGPPPQGGTYVETGPMSSAAGPRTSVDAPRMGQMPPSAPPAKKSKLAIPLIIGAVLVLICLVGGGIALAGSLLSGGEEPTPTVAPVVIINTVAPTIEAATDVPTETAIPVTPTPEGPYVVITNISIDGGYYSVDYEVHNLPPDPGGMHVHMFFNTVPPDQAGMSGSGPWKLTYGSYGPSPFKGYSTSSKPAAATQMCALIANANHSVQQNSGNCVDLP